MENRPSRIATNVFSGFFGAVIGVLGARTYRSSNYIPKVKEVQSGYVSPLDIKVRCEDLDKSDGNGLPETYFDIRDKSYILMFDSDNTPRLMEYEAIVPKVIPKYKAEKETK